MTWFEHLINNFPDWEDVKSTAIFPSKCWIFIFFTIIGYATAICSTINVLNFFTSEFFPFILFAIPHVIFYFVKCCTASFWTILFFFITILWTIQFYSKMKSIFNIITTFHPSLWFTKKFSLFFRIYWLKWSIKSRIITKSFVNIKMQ